MKFLPPQTKSPGYGPELSFEKHPFLCAFCLTLRNISTCIQGRQESKSNTENLP